MNTEMKQQLEKYMQADGFYDIRAIRDDLQEQGVNTRPSFDDIFAGSSDVDQPLQPSTKHPLWQAAIDANEAKERGETSTVDEILVKSDDEITVKEWKQLMSADKAESYYPPSPADMDLPLAYRRTVYPTKQTVETEEELANKGL